jgi:hypothetical protein
MAENEPNPKAGDLPQESSAKHKLEQHHVSKILDEVMAQTASSEIAARLRHPMLVDVVLALGLLVALAGFTLGLLRIYICHSAEQSITKSDFKAAIAILQGAPLPDLFAPPGSEPKELLDQALYLDAMQKLNADSQGASALKELEQIEPGSAFFALAQTILKEHYQPATIILQGGALKEEKITEEESRARQSEIPPVEENR